MLFRILIAALFLGANLFYCSGQADDEKVCEDLFAAACLGADGKNKFADNNKKMHEKALDSIQRARDKTAKELGFKNFDEALKQHLKTAGFEIKEPVDAEAWKLLKGEITPNNYNSTNLEHRLYEPVQSCFSNESTFNNISKDILKFNEEQLKQVQLQIETHLNSHNAKLISIYANDIPNFVTESIGQKCQQIKDKPLTFVVDNNREIFKACENFEQIRREAAQLYRIEGTPQYKEKASDFIKKNLLPEPKPFFKGLSQTSDEDSSDKRELEKLQEKIQSLMVQIRSICSPYSRLVRRSAQKSVEDFMIEINISKTTVDSLIGEFYTEANKSKISQMLEDTKSEAQNIVSQFVKDDDKRKAIVAEYNSLGHLWLVQPPPNSYKKGVRGNLILDEEKAVPEPVRKEMDDVYGFFSDPILAHFSIFNANFIPSLNPGIVKKKLRVSLMPVILQQLMNENPQTTKAMLAHEVAHKIGPRFSQLQGYSLDLEYVKLLDCYKNNNSIKLEPKQADEVIADYIASEIITRNMAALPLKDRKQALKFTMEFFCLADVMEVHSHSVVCDGNHPENSLRVSGIFGANPNLRKVIGCNEESSLYKSCGLENIKIPESIDVDRSPSPNGETKKGSQVSK